MSIRPASRSDASALGDVYLAARRAMAYVPTLHTDEETRAWLVDVVLATDEVWAAEEGGAVVGFAALSERLLDHLYVHPDAQARGVGSALLTLAKQRRPDGFRLWVFQQNDGARRFYQRHGLRLVELTDGSGNEEGVPDALYEFSAPPAPAEHAGVASLDDRRDRQI